MPQCFAGAHLLVSSQCSVFGCRQIPGDGSTDLYVHCELFCKSTYFFALAHSCRADLMRRAEIQRAIFEDSEIDRKSLKSANADESKENASALNATPKMATPNTERRSTPTPTVQFPKLPKFEALPKSQVQVCGWLPSLALALARTRVNSSRTSNEITICTPW